MRNPQEVWDYWRKNPINSHGTKCWWEKPVKITERKMPTIGKALLEEHRIENVICIIPLQEEDKPVLREKIDCIIADCNKIIEREKNAESF